MKKRILNTLKAYLDTNIEVLEKHEIEDIKKQIKYMENFKKSKKHVSDYTIKKVMVLCGIVALLGSILGYLVGWSMGLNYGEKIGEYNVIENASISHDSDYHYLEYNGEVYFYE